MAGRGRGTYYKNLYGGGRGRGGGGNGSGSQTPQGQHPHKRFRANDDLARTFDVLQSELLRLDGKSYPAYRDIEGSWDYSYFCLHVDHVQSDPYAPPSKLRLHVKHDAAKFPRDLYLNSIRTIALSDFLTRRLVNAVVTKSLGSRSSGWGGAKGGDINVDKPGQQILQRSSIVIGDTGIEARFTLGLPAQGRTIMGQLATEIFRSELPSLAKQLVYASHDAKELDLYIKSIEDQETLRELVRSAGLSAFVANGALLPRASGASDLPLRHSSLVKFRSPANLERKFTLPSGREVSGMGIPEGITLITGGGFHGKSTLLDALSMGCYNHIPGDGREFVVTSSSCVSIQGEDGRSIENVDISPFINNLPGGLSTTSFSTKDASGSTSMAAGVIEALELGADTILFDEDTCATNFLIRDRRMQRLIKADPITPLIFKIRSMYREHRCSSVLVIGGCGDYCDVADLVLEMRNYECHDITDAARSISQEIPSVVSEHEDVAFGKVAHRHLNIRTLPLPGAKLAVRGRATIQFTEDNSLNLNSLVQLCHDSQTRSIASALKKIAKEKDTTITDALRRISENLDRQGLDVLMEEGRIDGFLARPRALELGMALNRLR
ncbi:uncharacterized protein STEHIDRAFT_141068 [Stereum hirsutum FP-91666 SS1]|uniref:uncharacterized protein n=1 Tax=Stereum hirsutum (strain FP-91666) TaxID=721885 RepID=UPI000444A581|nr:uncharacterized protein STEHIDRAFT_141068 [Stereum hirsutum FP-91666 SS1]EIM83239.1 hypothetical protein STEHIDRAFT_141068 [Stereum hirsutum FP-91666 SS1]